MNAGIITASIIDTGEDGINLGGIINGVTYGAGGGLWTVINFAFNIPFPYFMITDMGMPALVAGVLQAVWILLLGLGLLEAVLGRDLLT
jgi:hypothetical protein